MENATRFRHLLGSSVGMTVKEALLAVFALGLLLGLWLGQQGERRRFSESQRHLEQRIYNLEVQESLLKPSKDASRGSAPGERTGRSREHLTVCGLPETLS